LLLPPGGVRLPVPPGLLVPPKVGELSESPMPPKPDELVEPPRSVLGTGVNVLVVPAVELPAAVLLELALPCWLLELLLLVVPLLVVVVPGAPMLPGPEPPEVCETTASVGADGFARDGVGANASETAMKIMATMATLRGLNVCSQLPA